MEALTSFTVMWQGQTQVERSSATRVDKKKEEKTVNAPNQLKIMNLVAGEREKHLVEDGKAVGCRNGSRRPA